MQSPGVKKATPKSDEDHERLDMTGKLTGHRWSRHSCKRLSARDSTSQESKRTKARTFDGEVLCASPPHKKSVTMAVVRPEALHAICDLVHHTLGDRLDDQSGGFPRSARKFYSELLSTCSE